MSNFWNLADILFQFIKLFEVHPPNKFEDREHIIKVNLKMIIYLFTYIVYLSSRVADWE